MRIYLLRHGRTAAGMYYNHDLKQPDPPLDDTGRRQAWLLGERLRGRGIATVYSSDLGRAAETAEIAAEHIGAAVVFRKEIREIDMGEVHVKGWAAFPDLYEQWKKHGVDLPYPGGESGEDVRGRAWPLVEEIARAGAGDAALVTHGGVIMVLVTACLGGGMERRFRLAPPANCGFSTLLHDPETGSFVVETFNDSSHLDHAPDLYY